MKSHQQPSLSLPPFCHSLRAWAAANQPRCPQPVPLSPTSPTVPSQSHCPQPVPPSPTSLAVPNQPRCPQPVLLSPTSPTVTNPRWCPPYLSRLCFFPVFFFFSLRMGEELSQLRGGMEKRSGVLERGARDIPAPSPWPRAARPATPPAPCFPWTTDRMQEHHVEVISWGYLGWGIERGFWQTGSGRPRCPIATWWALQPPAADGAASSHWDFRGVQHGAEVGLCPVAMHARRAPRSPPSPAGTHLRSEPGFLFLLPWGRRRRKGH